MKKDYLNKLIREIKGIDPRIEEKYIQEGRGVTFYGPSGNMSGRTTQKFFRIEDGAGEQFLGKFYLLKSQQCIRDAESVEIKIRATGDLQAEPFKFLVGDDTGEILAGVRKSFDLLLKRK